jgi:hypothetical protein
MQCEPVGRPADPGGARRGAAPDPACASDLVPPEDPDRDRGEGGGEGEQDADRGQRGRRALPARHDVLHPGDQVPQHGGTSRYPNTRSRDHEMTHVPEKCGNQALRDRLDDPARASAGQLVRPGRLAGFFPGVGGQVSQRPFDFLPDPAEGDAEHALAALEQVDYLVG